MKRLLVIGLVLAACVCISACDNGGGNGSGGDTTTGQVISVTATVTPTTYSGVCPKTFKFVGVITVDGPCQVTYRWAHEPYVNDEHTITFTAAGSQTVKYSWTVSTWLPSNERWLDLITSAPNLVIASPMAEFVLNCLDTRN